MKRIQLTASLAIMAILGILAPFTSGCTGSKSGAQQDGKSAQYTCSMHPEVVQDKPGDCPKCGMKLVEKH